VAKGVGLGELGAEQKDLRRVEYPQQDDDQRAGSTMWWDDIILSRAVRKPYRVSEPDPVVLLSEQSEAPVQVSGAVSVGFIDGVSRHAVNLQSRCERPLGRYFPEIIAAARHLPIEKFVFDGEVIIPDQPFDTLQLRPYPAAS
jgi:hypothetical protein